MRWPWHGWRKKPQGVLRLRPDPVLTEVTWDRFERACLLFGIDADAMFAGRISLSEIRTPPPSRAREVLDLLLVNAHAFNVGKMAPDRLSAFLALVVAEFFFTVAAPVEGPLNTKTT